jgi:ATP-dependent protease ClpP protease subunit
MFKLTPVKISLAIFLGVVSLGIGTLGTLGTTAVQLTEYPKEQGRVVFIDTQVDKESMVKATNDLKELQDSGRGKIAIKIKSPGGSVFEGRELLSRIQASEVQVDTFADNFIASMGMAIFLEGKERIVTFQAAGLLHRGSIGGVSYGTLKTMLSEVEMMKPSLEQAALLEQLRSMVTMMDVLFESEFRILEECKKIAIDPALTQSIIDSLKVGDRDIILTGEQMYLAGIATKIVTKLNTAEYK